MRKLTIIATIIIFVLSGYFLGKKYFDRESNSENRIAELENQVATLSNSYQKLSEKLGETDKTFKAELDAKSQTDDRVAEQLKAIQTSLKKPDTAKAISTWRSRVARIQCSHSAGFISGGSGVLVYEKGSSYSGISVLTNKHVATDYISRNADVCVANFPELKEDVTGWDHYGEIEPSTDYDAAYIHVTKPSNAVVNTFTAETKICTTKAQIGTPIVIIGYPVTGSRDDITATEGIVSGYENSFYITSAKVEQGNSGGIAVNIKENCLLGLPTYSSKGALESLARILDIRVLKL